MSGLLTRRRGSLFPGSVASADVTFVNSLTETTTMTTSHVTTGTLSPTVGKPYIVFVAGRISAGDSNVPTLTGGGQTWTALRTDMNAEAAGRNMNAFGCIAVAGSGTLTADWGGQTQQASIISVIEVTGAYQAGTINDVIVGDQVESQYFGGAFTTSFTGRMSAASDAANATLLAVVGTFGLWSSANMTEIVETDQTEFDFAVYSSGDVITQPDLASTTATHMVYAAMEIRAAAAVAHSGVKRRVLDKVSTASTHSTQATASISPAANALVLVFVMTTSTVARTTTLANNAGLTMGTWVEVGNVTFNTVGTPVSRLTVLRAMSATPGSGSIQFTHSGNSLGTSVWVVEFTGTVTTGASGADAVRNIVTNNGDAGTAVSVTLAAFNAVKNNTFLAAGWDVAGNPTPGNGFSPLETGSVGDNAVNNMESSHLAGGANITFGQWNRANDTTPDLTIPAADWGAVALEIVAA